MSVDLIMWLKQSLYIFYNSNQRFIISVEKKTRETWSEVGYVKPAPPHSLNNMEHTAQLS